MPQEEAPAEPGGVATQVPGEHGPGAEEEPVTTLTAREMDVMSVLWDLGSATVAEVSDQLDDDLAYTTVLTVLRILESKGLVGHEREGRAHRYHPLLERREAGRSVLDRLREKVYSGSTEMLVANLVSDERLSAQTIRRLRKLLDERLEKEERR